MSAAILAAHVVAGRTVIADMAKADREDRFAREVLAGCWDHRRDVAREIDKAKREAD